MDAQEGTSQSVSSLAEELSGRVNKTERPDRQLQRSLMDKINNLVRIERDPFIIIKANADVLAKDELSVAHAITVYENVMEARHNVWYDFIYTRKNSNWRDNGRESTFRSFCKALLDWDIKDADDHNYRPDIMLVNKRTNVILIGDITVTSNSDAAATRKHEKYSCLVKILAEKEIYTVDHHDMIIREDMTNIGQEIRRLQSKEVMPWNLDFSTHRDYCEYATDLMISVKNLCSDKRAFMLGLEEKQRKRELEGSRRNYSLLEGLLHEDIQRIELEPYIPKMSESDIISMIKVEVDRLGGTSYFKTTEQDVEDAFEDVLSKNRGRKVMPAKSTLKVIDNSHTHVPKTDLELLESYILDLASGPPGDVKNYLLDLIPSYKQVQKMIEVRDSKMTLKEAKESDDLKEARVYGRYQYKRIQGGTNLMTQNLTIECKKGSKGNRNVKKEPAVIDVDNLPFYESFITGAIKYYGSVSEKPAFLDDSWDAYNKVEEENTREEREQYRYVKSTNGAQLCNAMSGLYNRIMHMSTQQGKYDNVYIPPNGSFICIIPNDHAPVDRSNCDLPMIYITRTNINDSLTHIEYEHQYSSNEYTYYVSKLSRLNVGKIGNWNSAGERLCSSATFLLSKCKATRQAREEVVGLLTYLILDVHQKVSEYLDLLKYISFMPFAELNKLPSLITDKCDLLMKTKMDAWMFNRIRSYIKELHDVSKLEAEKPTPVVCNGMVHTDSLGITMKLPSFFNVSIRHNDPTEFIEEVSMLFTSRPKQLYGSQFLDMSITMTAQWQLDFEKEKLKYGTWATKGFGDGTFPFESQFCFSADAMYYASNDFEKHVEATSTKLESHLFSGTFSGFMHENCSLRGSTIDKTKRKNQDNMHTTSIGDCLEVYKEKEFDERGCRAISIAQDFITSGKIMEFSMSQKEQRGSGRPIATPTLGTKAALMMVEKPEATIGSFVRNNILVAGKNKLKEQHTTYKETISIGLAQGLSKVYQLTEDQTKYSENDNPYKYEIYLRTSTLLKPEIRKLQLAGLRKLYHRRHLIHRLPERVMSDPELHKQVYTDENTRSVWTEIGWPQGMLNNLSTTIHSMCDYWIAKAFKLAYPNSSIYVQGLVHSDDSWVTVCVNNKDDFLLFTLFRMVAKQLFCLKINKKKLWGGKHLGELVSNYNLNGRVHLTVSKCISNGMSNLTYHNWAIDVNNQVSVIQQVYRAGGKLGIMIMLKTILRQQVTRAYHIEGTHKRLIYELPIELGGFPNCSAFKLGVGGVNAAYDELAEQYRQGKYPEAYQIVCAAAAVTRQTVAEGNDSINREHWATDDYAEVSLPSKGELLKGVKYLLPKSSKLKHSLQTIYEVTKDYPDDGLGMIVTKPTTLAESLGHLRQNTSGTLYKLASEGFGQSKRRLAISQAQQASGKVVRIDHVGTMTMNEMFEYLATMVTLKEDDIMVAQALQPDNEVIWACTQIVETAVIHKGRPETRGNVINRMPEFESKYDTISPFKDVLLHIIDRHYASIKKPTNYYDRYGTNMTCIETLKNDAENIKARFPSYFRYYPVVRACSIIMQNKYNTIKERTWVQPRIEAETMTGFLESLYGVTLREGMVYEVYSQPIRTKQTETDSSIVRSLYTAEVMNRVFPGKFIVEKVGDKTPSEALNSVDPIKLNSNDALKYGVLMMNVCGNTDYLSKIHNDDRFIYKWIKRQRFSNGKYSGDWCVKYQIGQQTGQIKFSSGRVYITTSSMMVPPILTAMRLIASRCFNKNYEFDNGWASCQLWATREMPREGYQYYLKSRSYLSTTIVSQPEEGCIALILDSTVRIQDVVIKQAPEGFTTDNALRVVSVVLKGDDGKHQEYRMASIRQDLSIPLRKSMALEPTILDGFLSEELFQQGIMEDVMLNRPIGAPMSTIRSMISRAIGTNKSRPVWNVALTLYHKKHGLAMPRLEEEVDLVEDFIVYDWVIEDRGIQDHVEFHKTTNVESLDAAYIDFENEAMLGQNKIKRSKSIMRLLCKQLWASITESNVYDFIVNIVDHPITKKVASQPNRYINELTNDEGWILGNTPNTELFSFVYGKMLDTDKFWYKVRGDKLRDIKARPCPFEGEKNIVSQYANYVAGVLEMDPPPPPEDNFVMFD
uniref:RNA-directed RNA polymerase L n=1 Tax=Orthophasmavirus aedis TaxID=3052543 RepID=A0A8B0RJW9_9VIRU|nr:RNA-dependent RNA polymerase [Orthophasmavirus aedis]